MGDIGNVCVCVRGTRNCDLCVEIMTKPCGAVAFLVLMLGAQWRVTLLCIPRTDIRIDAQAVMSPLGIIMSRENACLLLWFALDARVSFVSHAFV